MRKELYYANEIFVAENLPNTEPIAAVMVFHGMTEHVGRYEKFTDFLNDRGIATVLVDLPGHGKSSKNGSMTFGEAGWNGTIKKLRDLVDIEKSKMGDVPFFLYGFSLGSFILRCMLIDYPEMKIDGAILAGTGHQGTIELSLGKMMAQKEVNKVGYVGFSETIDNLAFAGYNKKFEQNTAMDWLCSNQEALQEYFDDELVVPHLTAGLFRDLICGIAYCTKAKNIAKMSKSYPVLLVSGKDDAVGKFGSGVEKVSNMFSKASIKNEYKLYDCMRHDLLHEKKAEVVMEDIAKWIQKHV